MLLWQLLCGILATLTCVKAQIIIASSATLDNVVSADCKRALETQADCTVGLINLATTHYFGVLDESILDVEVCSKACKTSLASYRDAVSASCKSDPQPWNNYSATHFSDLLSMYQNIACQQDARTGQYCMNQISEFAASTSSKNLQQLPESLLCSSCFQSLMTEAQVTAFGKGVARQWKTAQKSCGTGYDKSLATQPLFATQPSHAFKIAPFPASNKLAKGEQICLSGNMYTIVPGDTSISISKAKGVATGALQAINGLFPDGSNMPAFRNIPLCLPHTCQTYVVQSHDTCWTIARANKISYTKLLGMNPTINDECSNLTPGHHICLSHALGVFTATKAVAGAIGTAVSPYALTTIEPPSPVASGTTKLCGRYYLAKERDTCSKISLRQSIDVELFEAINSSINAACTNLKCGEYYCVLPRSDWNAHAPRPATPSTG